MSEPSLRFENTASDAFATNDIGDRTPPLGSHESSRMTDESLGTKEPPTHILSSALSPIDKGRSRNSSVRSKSRDNPYVAVASPIHERYLGNKFHPNVQTQKSGSLHGTTESNPEARDEILYKLFSNPTINASFTESIRGSTLRSISPLGLSTLKNPETLEKSVVQETIHELYGSVFNHSRPTSSLGKSHVSMRRPKSASSVEHVDRTTLHIPSKGIDTPGGKVLLKENTTVESRIYEANAQQKIREANDCCRALGSEFTWELAPREMMTTPLRVYQITNGKVTKEISMDMFLREYRRLGRERDRVWRESRFKLMEDQYRTDFDKNPDEGAKEARAIVRNLLLETMQLISKLQDQTEKLAPIFDS